MRESIEKALITPRLNRRQFALFLGAGAATLLAACGDDDDDEPAVPGVDDDDDDDDDETPTPEPVDDDDEDDEDQETPEPDDDEDDDDVDDREAVELIIGASNEPNTMDPHYSIGRHTEVFHVNIYDSLIKRDVDNEFFPGLAESWENLDERTWQFSLREGVTFHNGDPFTADDVEFTITRILDPETQANTAIQLSTISHAEVIDDYTVNIVTHEPDVMVLARLTELYGVILPKNYVEEVGAEVVAQNPIGTGPFQFVEWATNERIVLEANPDYWRGRANVDRVTVRPILDDSTRISALQAAEVDMINAVPFVRIPELENDPEIEVKTAASPRIFYVNIDPREAPFDDVRVRQAMNYAVDVEAIIDSILMGYGNQLATVINTQSFGYDQSIEPYPYDPDRARELLTEAGYPDGFETQFDAFTGSIADHSRIAEAVVEYLRQVGINAEMNMMEFGAFGPLRLGNQLAPLWIYSFGNWAAMEAYVLEWMTMGDASAFYQNDELDALIEEYNVTFDEDERLEIASEMQRILKEDAGFIYLLEGEQVFAMRSHVSYDPRPDEMFELYSLSVTS
jgi:peptide/nickel transport system substrate-binding protein